MGGVLGGIAAWRLLRRRGRPAPEVAPAPPAAEIDPRAEALRAKLDEVREAEPQVEPEVEPDVVPEPEPPPESKAESADPDERRRSVHEHGRAALEEMHGGEGGEAAS